MTCFITVQRRKEYQVTKNTALSLSPLSPHPLLSCPTTYQSCDLHAHPSIHHPSTYPFTRNNYRHRLNHLSIRASLHPSIYPITKSILTRPHSWLNYPSYCARVLWSDRRRIRSADTCLLLGLNISLSAVKLPSLSTHSLVYLLSSLSLNFLIDILVTGCWLRLNDWTKRTT